jgi:hypothetical protein
MKRGLIYEGKVEAVRPGVYNSHTDRSILEVRVVSYHCTEQYWENLASRSGVRY